MLRFLAIAFLAGFVSPAFASTDDDALAALALAAARRQQPVAIPVAPIVSAVQVPIGHTHTCAACAAKGIVSTWDHATVSGHNCPTCGREQLEQDPVPRPVTVGKVTQPVQQYQLPQFGTSGCPGGVCNVPQQQTRPFLFPRLRGQ